MLLRRVSILAIALLSLGSTVALAGSNARLPQTVAQKPPGRMLPQGGKDRLMQELNLSPDQMKRIESIQTENKTRMTQQMQALRKAQDELSRMMAGTADSNQIRDKYNQVASLRQDLMKSQFDSMLAMRDVLSAEQRAKLAQLMQNQRANLQNRPANGSRQRQ